MIKVTLKAWRTAGVAATLSVVAACGGEAGAPAGEGGEAANAPAVPAGEGGEGEGGSGPGEGGGEAGEAGAASAYAGLSGDQLTALRLQHLKGFVMAAERVAGQNQTAEAGVLVQQGLLEVYDVAPDQFGALNVEAVRAASDGSVAHIRAAEAAIDSASGALNIDHAALAARMVDIATGLYREVNQPDFVDPIEYQHSMGAALAAQSALEAGQADLRGENARAYQQARDELSRFVGMWASPTAPEQPPSYAQVLAQGSRVRLALSPYL